MDRNIVTRLVERDRVIPEVEYSDNILELRRNVQDTIHAVRRRLGALTELQSYIEYIMTLNHLDDNEEELI